MFGALAGLVTGLGLMSAFDTAVPTFFSLLLSTRKCVFFSFPFSSYGCCAPRLAVPTLASIFLTRRCHVTQSKRHLAIQVYKENRTRQITSLSLHFSFLNWTDDTTHTLYALSINRATNGLPTRFCAVRCGAAIHPPTHPSSPHVHVQGSDMSVARTPSINRGW